MVSSRRRVALRTCQEGADHVKGSYGCRSSNGGGGKVGRRGLAGGMAS